MGIIIEIKMSIVVGESNIKAKSIVSPTTSAIVATAIPGAANMNHIRRSLGAEIVKKYVARSQDQTVTGKKKTTSK